MSEFDAKKIRAERREKARERGEGGDPHRKVDASDWTPPEQLNTEAKTGERPISKRQYKRGGKAEGPKAHHHAGRKPRASGGKTVIDDYVNRDVREANAKEHGRPHIGGYKTGGRAHKAMGGPQASPAAATPAAANPVPTSALNLNGRTVGAAGSGPMKRGGRSHHAAGGHADEAADRKLVDHMVKRECRTGNARGGKADEKHWIHGAIEHPGALRKELHAKAGKDIPEKKLEKAAHSENPKLAKRARLAETLKGMHHKDGGKANYTGGTRPTGGRIARAEGGKTIKPKGKTNINIVVNPHGSGGPDMQQGAPMMRPAAPPPAPVPMAPPGGGAGMAPPPMGAGAPPPMAGPGGMPGGMPPGMPPQMPRKRGGRTYTAGAGGGEGRLQKIEEYGEKPPA